jgi:hypothetical protein
MSVLVSKRSGLSVTACRRANDCKPGGRSADRGMLAPFTRTGMTRTPRVSAVSISRRTKSSELSKRRPYSSEMASHCSPITATKAAQEATAVVIASAKSSPGSSESTSLNTWSRPKCSTSRSNSHPAG